MKIRSFRSLLPAPLRSFHGNSHGSRVLLTLIELLVVGTAIFFIFEFAVRAGSSEEVAVDTVASEFSHMINILAGDSHVIKVGYPENLSKYGFALTSHSITVYTIKTADDGEVMSGTFDSEKSFVLPASWDATGSVEGMESICLVRNNSLILLTACEGNS